MTEISDELAMKILEDLNWNDNNDVNDNIDKNDNDEEIKENFIQLDDEMNDILELIKLEKENNDNKYENTNTNEAKNLLFKNKNAEFQISFETLMRWNIDCESIGLDEDDSTINNINDNNV